MRRVAVGVTGLVVLAVATWLALRPSVRPGDDVRRAFDPHGAAVAEALRWSAPIDDPPPVDPDLVPPRPRPAPDLPVVVCNAATWATPDLREAALLGETDVGALVTGMWAGDAAVLLIADSGASRVWVAPEGRPDVGVDVTWTPARPWAACDTAVAAPRAAMPM